MQEATGLSTHLQQPPLRPPEGWLCSRVNSVHVPRLRGLSIFALLPQGDKGSGKHPKGDVKQQILVLMSQPGNLRWDAKEAFKLDPGVPRSPEETRWCLLR